MQAPDYLTHFTARLDEIDKLEATPQLVRQQAISALDNILKQDLNHSVRQVVTNAKGSLNNISASSIAENYKAIYAQMCILAVSNLEAILKQYFEDTASDQTRLHLSNKDKEQIKVSLNDIIENKLSFDGKLGHLILEKQNLNFQDLKSILRNFKDYLGKDIRLTEDTKKKVCFYLEVRHVLVHKGGHVDKKFIRNTTVLEANLQGLKEGDSITLGSTDWANIKEAFTTLIGSVVS